MLKSLIPAVALASARSRRPYRSLNRTDLSPVHKRAPSSSNSKRLALCTTGHACPIADVTQNPFTVFSAVGRPGAVASIGRSVKVPLQTGDSP